MVYRVKEVLQNAHEPLPPQDFTSSIHYNKCYDKVLRKDADKYMDGDVNVYGYPEAELPMSGVLNWMELNPPPQTYPPSNPHYVSYAPKYNRLPDVPNNLRTW